MYSAVGKIRISVTIAAYPHHLYPIIDEYTNHLFMNTRPSPERDDKDVLYHRSGTVIMYPPFGGKMYNLIIIISP